MKFVHNNRRIIFGHAEENKELNKQTIRLLNALGLLGQSMLIILRGLERPRLLRSWSKKRLNSVTAARQHTTPTFVIFGNKLQYLLCQ
jgi:hypothetical protein